MHGVLTSSFPLATNSVEKFLKAFLLFSDQALGASAKRVKEVVSDRSKRLGRAQERGHDVEAALELAIEAGLTCADKLRTRVRRINLFHEMRYQYGLLPFGGDDVHEYDEAVFEIWSAFENVNHDYYCTSGPLRPVYGFVIQEAEA
ncbi:MAG TPA: hypothetical protein VH024_09650, partial [Candidatus Angelobacter sp.]|nr:hypothetical protein [Candidatus Angelobacter sp.]